MPNKGTKVSQFAPEFLEAFQAGSRKEIVIRFPTEAQAATFVSRMNKLRQAMRREDHFMLNLAEGVTISNYPDKLIVRVRPVDSQFLEAVKTALKEQTSELDFDGNESFAAGGEDTLPISQAERDAIERANKQFRGATIQSRSDSDVSSEANERRGDTGNQSGRTPEGNPEDQPESETLSEQEKLMQEFMKGKKE